MNIDLSRRGFLRLAGAGVAATSLEHGLRRGRGSGGGACARVQAGHDHGNTQHLSLLLGRLRDHHVFARGREGRRNRRADAYRGRCRSPDEPRNAVPQGRRAEGLCPCAHAPDAAPPAPSGIGPLRGDHLGGGAGQDCPRLKDDRDANFIATNDDGTPVNRWTTTGFLAASATTNETAWLTYKTVRSMGIVGFDNQARV